MWHFVLCQEQDTIIRVVQIALAPDIQHPVDVFVFLVIFS
jgi:hypothetical protein